MANRYWIDTGANATWTATNTANWAATSGGAGGASVPTAADDVIFDANSGTHQCLTTSSASVCRSLNATGFAGTIRLANAAPALSVGDASGGAFTVPSALLTFQQNSVISFVSTSDNGGAGWPITFSSNRVAGLTFNGTGGKWRLMDDILVIANNAAVGWNLTAGTLDPNGHNITCTSMTIQTAFTCNFGTITLTLTAQTTMTILNIVSAAAPLTTSNLTVVLGSTAVSGVIRTLLLSNRTFKAITYTVAGSAGVMQLNSNGATIGTLTVTSNAVSLGVGITVNTWLVSGVAGALATVSSSVPGTQRTLTTTAAQTVSDYLLITDISAVGGVWYAGANSVDGGNNAGWLFYSPLSSTFAVALGFNASALAVPAATASIALSTGATSAAQTGVPIAASLALTSTANAVVSAALLTSLAVAGSAQAPTSAVSALGLTVQATPESLAQAVMALGVAASATAQTRAQAALAFNIAANATVQALIAAAFQTDLLVNAAAQTRAAAAFQTDLLVSATAQTQAAAAVSIGLFAAAGGAAEPQATIALAATLAAIASNRVTTTVDVELGFGADIASVAAAAMALVLAISSSLQLQADAAIELELAIIAIAASVSTGGAANDEIWPGRRPRARPGRSFYRASRSIGRGLLSGAAPPPPMHAAPARLFRAGR